MDKTANAETFHKILSANLQSWSKYFRNLQCFSTGPINQK